jgi:hypothetical protein
MPAAPAVAVHGINHLGDKVTEVYPKETINLSGLVGNKFMSGKFVPPQLNQYHEAIRANQAWRDNHYRMLDYRRNHHQMNPNIMVLKSVTLQHKIHMQMKRDKEVEEAERSFSEALIDSLGLREYFKKQSEEDACAASSPSGGY